MELKKNLYNIGNVTLDRENSGIYGNIDGLSLQNLFYTNYGVFPGVYSFNYEPREFNGYKLDTYKVLKYLTKTFGDDVKITTYIIGKIKKDKNNEESLGICVMIENKHIYARFEEDITESYILYDNTSYDTLKSLVNRIIKCFVPPKKIENVYWRLCSSNGGYYLDKGKIKCPENFDITKQYNDNLQKENDKICSFIEEEDKSGLVLLHGEKGTGKSTYIKHLVAKYPNRKFVYVPSNLVNLLGDPSFGSFLTTLDNHIIVMEDCENVIQDRKTNQGSASAVSLLLNMTDGILSDDLGMKFICTFNDNMKSIDSALLRKGRLISKYEFKPLDVEKANALLEELGSEEKTTKPISLAEVFHFGEEGYEITKKTII